MPPNPPLFRDATAYEHGMGVWSSLVGQQFLDWLHPPMDLRWIDVGCGSGALAELLAERCAPRHIHGIDPSEAQLDFARARLLNHPVTLRRGDALALPFDSRSFDAAVMALVIFFVPDPSQAVAEMVRVVVPGGIVAAYAWDYFRVALHRRRSLRNCRRLAVRRSICRPVWRCRVSTSCMISGRRQAWRTSTRGRFRSRDNLPPSTISGMRRARRRLFIARSSS